MSHIFKELFSLNNINITGKIKSKLGMNLSHEFIFLSRSTSVSQPLSINLYFSLPTKSVVSNFEISYGNQTLKSLVSKSNLDSNFSENISSQTTYKLSALDMDAGNYLFSMQNFIPVNDTPLILKVNSVVVFENSRNGATLQIPLSTNPDNLIDEENNNKEPITAETSIKIITKRTEETKNSNIYSATHACTSDFDDECSTLSLKTKSAGFFGLNIDYYVEFRNKAYITGNSISGYKAVYLFKPNTTEKNKCYDIIYFLDNSNPNSSTNRIAKTALIELLKNQPKNTKFGICTTEGNIYSDRLITPKFNIIQNVEKWLIKNDNNNPDYEVSYESYSGIYEKISKLLNQSPFAEIIYITTHDSIAINNFLDILNKSNKIPINVFSVDTLNYSQGQKTLAKKTNGIYAIMQKGHNYYEFTKSFIKRMFSEYLTNLKIYENSAGTYFNTPSNIDLYRTNDILTYTLASTTEYPVELFLSADGDFRDHIRFENIRIIDNDKNTELIFGQIIINSIHNYILNNSLTPESILKLKQTAIKLSCELNILSPYTACSAQISLEPDEKLSEVAPLKLSLYLSGKTSDEHKDIVTIFGDIQKLDTTTREQFAEKYLRVLLLCLNSDSSLTNNANSQAKIKTQTAYAAQAIITATDNLKIANADLYKNIARDAIEYLGGEESFSSIPIIYDGSDMPNLSDYASVAKSLDIIKISRLLILLALGK